MAAIRRDGGAAEAFAADVTDEGQAAASTAAVERALGSSAAAKPR